MAPEWEQRELGNTIKPERGCVTSCSTRGRNRQIERKKEGTRYIPITDKHILPFKFSNISKAVMARKSSLFQSSELFFSARESSEMAKRSSEMAKRSSEMARRSFEFTS